MSVTQWWSLIRPKANTHGSRFVVFRCAHACVNFTYIPGYYQNQSKHKKHVDISLAMLYNRVIPSIQIHNNNNIDGLVQERRNSMVNALGLRLSCTNSSVCSYAHLHLCLRVIVGVLECLLFGAKPLSKPLMVYCCLEPWNKSSWHLS